MELMCSHVTPDKQTEWGTELEELKGEIIQEGCELSFQRHSSAGRLRSAVEQCLEQLAMTSSRFDVRISWEKAYLVRSILLLSFVQIVAP